MIGLLLVSLNGFSQDPQFSQYYAHPLYLNPALAGTGECSRVMLNYRNQWPSISGGFKTYAFSADLYSDALSGGLGLSIYADDAAGLVNTIRAGGMYAYHLNLGQQTSLNMGIEAAFFQQKLMWDELVFSDMINYTDGTVLKGVTGEVPPDRTTISVVDFSAGLVLGIREKYYIGFASNHLTEPDLGYYSNSSNPLFRKYTAHAGALFTVLEGDYRSERGKLILNPNVLYQQQQNAKQLNAGCNVEFMPLIAGIWYRHNFVNPDGFIFLVGLKQKRYKFGYSYDLTMSELSGESGGAHEISFALLINCDKRNRPGAIKCPEF
ncbi:MAG: PorP/SprF family type IX secretion system membrane protein [Bacteroidetes bacterium]|nr:PorP/SprF family type IX secretion system membrane protein [Bacteroidota bacterium]